MRRIIYFCLVLLIVCVFFSHTTAVADDLYPTGQLQSGLYQSPDGSVITQATCTVETGIDVIFKARDGIILSPERVLGTSINK